MFLSATCFCLKKSQIEVGNLEFLWGLSVEGSRALRDHFPIYQEANRLPYSLIFQVGFQRLLDYDNYQFILKNSVTTKLMDYVIAYPLND